MAKWWCSKCGKKFSAGENDRKCPKCGDEYAMAVYASSRVRGDKYTPYPDNSLWARNANGQMADAARANFERKHAH